MWRWRCIRNDCSGHHAAVVGEAHRQATDAGVLKAGATGLEPATSGVTGRRSNQLSYAPTNGA